MAWRGCPSSSGTFNWGTSNPTIQFLGDSNTVGNDGVETGIVGGYRHGFYNAIRSWRDDFDFVGSHFDGTDIAVGFSDWYHDGVAGSRFADYVANFPGFITAIGACPDIIVDMMGTPDIVDGRNLAFMQAGRQSVDAVITATCPKAKRVVLAIPTMVAGTIVGGNLAAWMAVINAYNAWLAGYCALKGYRFLNFPALLGPGDIQSDGVHLNLQGANALGLLVAEDLDRYVLGTRRGLPIPKAFRQRKPWRSMYIPQAGSLTTTNHPGFRPNDSFKYAFDFFPIALIEDGNSYEIMSYGAFPGPPSVLISQRNKILNVHFNGVSLFVQNNQYVLRENTWHRIVLHGQLNGANSAMGVYVNGELVALHNGLAAWSLALASTVLGKSTLGAGAEGYYARIQACKGALTKPGTIAALRAAESDYYLGGSLCTSLGTASFPLDADLNDEIGANPPFVAAGGAAFAPAYPGGSPRRPWEMKQLLVDGNRGLVTLNGDVAVNVAHTDIRSNDVLQLHLRTKAGTGTGLAPVVAITKHVGFSVVSVAGDTSTWAWQLEPAREAAL